MHNHATLITTVYLKDIHGVNLARKMVVPVAIFLGRAVTAATGTIPVVQLVFLFLSMIFAGDYGLPVVVSK